jgi:hypothetical protein
MTYDNRSACPSALEAAERNLLELGATDAKPSPIFILGAPRTGSTVLYQAMAAAFRLPYIANFTNRHFPSNPIVGIAIQNGIRVDIGFESAFGKTEGLFQPSEGSAVMTCWFGGGHPSQIVSTCIRQGSEPHFTRTLAAVEAICGAPLLVKNAWHCFRVAYLARALPKARFVWIRRDIRDAALSDLKARRLTKGDLNAWNSATPADVAELRTLPPEAQVVENQHAFNAAIGVGLRSDAPSRAVEIWYEDFIADPAAALTSIGEFIGIPLQADAPLPHVYGRCRKTLGDSEFEPVCRYVLDNRTRFYSHVHPSRGDLG